MVTGKQYQQAARGQGENERLLYALAEHIKAPLTHIARAAELARDQADTKASLELIGLSADTAIQLLDTYLLSLRLQQASQQPALEPVSLSAVLNDVAHKLSAVADAYQCDVQLQLAGKYEPVVANRQALELALVSLGQVFIEAVGSQTETRAVVSLAAHRSAHGLVAGMFGEIDGLSSAMFRKSRDLYGTSHRPLNQITASSGVGVFIADSLLSTMSAHLRVAHHHKLSGLAATFMPSQQLSLV